MSKFNAGRWVIFADGKWQGGSFGSKKEADTEAAKLKGKIEIRQRGAKSEAK